ncbi:MAG TPA: plastocyanin/azurin family copper-binding protein [Mycobacteriales bacterium]|nr:plastocyanin/azurin family copper-binding protein [Mycobacteriales bacterium]
MTDTTTTDQPEQPAGVEAPPAAEVEAQAAAGEPVPFWQRPYVERYLVPLVLPVAVIVGLVVYVLDVSRLFLSAHGHLPVVIGTVITVSILFGAALLASAPRMRQASRILVTAGFLLALTFSGWISLGHSEDHNAVASTLPATLKAKQTLSVTAGPSLSFTPSSLNAQTGLVKFTVNFAGSHTFGFHEVSTLFPELKAAQPQESAVAYFGTPGDYNYFCSIPGHEAAGMHGIVHVAGPPVALAKALADAGNPPTAAAG